MERECKSMQSGNTVCRGPQSPTPRLACGASAGGRTFCTRVRATAGGKAAAAEEMEMDCWYLPVPFSVPFSPGWHHAPRLSIVLAEQNEDFLPSAFTDIFLRSRTRHGGFSEQRSNRWVGLRFPGDPASSFIFSVHDWMRVSTFGGMFLKRKEHTRKLCLCARARARVCVS